MCLETKTTKSLRNLTSFIHSSFILRFFFVYKESMEKYTLVKVIGEGSFGRAVLVCCKSNQEQYVVKEIQLPKVRENKDGVVAWGFPQCCMIINNMLYFLCYKWRNKHWLYLDPAWDVTAWGGIWKCYLFLADKPTRLLPTLRHSGCLFCIIRNAFMHVFAFL